MGLYVQTKLLGFGLEDGGDWEQAYANGQFDRPGFMAAVPGVGSRIMETFEKLDGALVEELRAAGQLGTWIATQLFASDASDATLLHYDEADNMFLQGRGSKRFDLYEPTASSCRALSPFPAHSRRDRNARTPVRGGAKLVVTLREGEVLFLPAYWWHRVQTLEDDTLSLNFWFHAHLHLAYAADETSSAPLPAKMIPVLARQCEIFLGDNMGSAFVGSCIARLATDLGIAHGVAPRWPEEPAVEKLVRGFLAERLAEQLGAPELVVAFVGGFLHPSRWAAET